MCRGAVSRTLQVEGQKKKTALVCLLLPAICRHKHSVKHHRHLAAGWFVTNEKGNAFFANHFLSQAAADSCPGFADFREAAFPLETMISFVASAAAGNFESGEGEEVAEFVRAEAQRPSAPATPFKRVKLSNTDAGEEDGKSGRWTLGVAGPLRRRQLTTTRDKQ